MDVRPQERPRWGDVNSAPGLQRRGGARTVPQISRRLGPPTGGPPWGQGRGRPRRSSSDAGGAAGAGASPLAPVTSRSAAAEVRSCASGRRQGVGTHDDAHPMAGHHATGGQADEPGGDPPPFVGEIRHCPPATGDDHRQEGPGHGHAQLRHFARCGSPPCTAAPLPSADIRHPVRSARPGRAVTGGCAPSWGQAGGGRWARAPFLVLPPFRRARSKSVVTHGIFHTPSGPCHPGRLPTLSDVVEGLNGWPWQRCASPSRSPPPRCSHPATRRRRPPAPAAGGYSRHTR